jgi:amino-acid N-acetyltransferase
MIVRSADKTDQAAIRRLAWRASLYPLDLSWRHFQVAEEEGRIVGAGQVRRHVGGSLELASVVVTRDYRRRGVGSLLVSRLIENQEQDVYVFCREELAGYYTRHGFRHAPPLSLPRDIARMYRIESFCTLLLFCLSHPRRHILAMKHTPFSAHWIARLRRSQKPASLKQLESALQVVR